MTVKISELPAGTDFQSGDVLPIVQDNTTKKLDANGAWFFGSVSTPVADITGGAINDTPIGATAANTASFTDLAYSGTLTGGTGVVDLGSGQLYKDADGKIGIGTDSPSEALHVVGDIVATGDITAFFSDDRLKTRTGSIENALGKVQSLTGFYYEPNQLAQSLGYEVQARVGVSAQEVQAVLPECVKEAAVGDGYLTVDYSRLVPLLIEAVKELSAKVEALGA